jgi:crotonobetaine/carnitine-CoA ligase
MFSGLNDPTTWVIPRVMDEMGKRKPAELWFTHIEGGTLTFGEAASDMHRVAQYFADLGIKPGERVAVFMRNSCDFVRVWLGLGRLGAVAVLLNTELRGAFLAHQLTNSAVTFTVVDADLLTVFESVDAGSHDLLRTVVVGDIASESMRKKAIISFSNWQRAGVWDGPWPLYRDIACIMYTSGTTGPSKGVLMPHAHCALYGVGVIEALKIGPGDRYYINLPLIHANGLLMQLCPTILAGIPAVVRTRFSASSWLLDLRKYQPTVTNVMGSIAAFIQSVPPTAYDRDHKLVKIISAPNMPAHEAVFRERFGIRDVISGFGMTEVNIPIWGRLGCSLPGKSGWAYSRYFEVRIADPETDEPMKPGEQGEIQIRPKLPFGFGAGYFNMPDQTVQSWRNLWFHTGDAATMSTDGVVTYVDRIKDCIRRRGENISASEVEAVVVSLPGVSEVVAYAIASDIPGAEDDLALAIVPEEGEEIDLQLLAEQVEDLLPRFAKPRYLRIVSDLPRTATGKVQRAMLRRQGIADAIDREIVR